MIKDQELHALPSENLVSDHTLPGEITKTAYLLPLFTLTTAVGLLVIVLAYNSARVENGWGNILYWTGLFTLFAPILARLLSKNVTRKERIALVLILGLSFYLVKIFYSPLEFKFPDELQHWRTLSNIMQSQHMFTPNYDLPVSPFYPGLEIVTDAFITISKLPVFEAGVIVVAITRVVLTLALFLAYERISGSTRAAGVASALYMTNPHYMFMNAFFIYQSLGIALTAFALYLITKSEYAKLRSKVGYQILFLLALSAVIVTHHLTSYVLLFLLMLWFAATYYVRRGSSRPTWISWAWVLALVEIVTWVALVAPGTIDYFMENISGVITDLSHLLGGKSEITQVFHAPNGPLVERVINIAVVGVVALCLVPSLWAAWKRYQKNPLALMLVLGSLTYFASLVTRVVSSHGAEFAGRSWSFVYLMVAFVLAVGIEEAWKRWGSQRQWVTVFTALIFLMFSGGIFGGWPPFWERLPGGYQVGAFESSVEPQGVAAADWALEYLGPANRIAGDFINYTLMGTYGGQDPVRAVFHIFYSGERDPEDIRMLDHYSVRYLVVDNRMGQALPSSGRYFDAIDPKSYQYTNPINPAALNKFDQWADASRIFDSGDIVIYDIHKLSTQP